MKLHLLNTAHGLFPCTDTDQESKLKLKIGDVYEVSIKKFRNYEFHKKYFALINTAWEYLSEKQTEFFKEDKTLFRKTMEISAGHCEKVYNNELNAWIDCPKSIAFDKMDNYQFQDLYERVREVIFTIALRNAGITEEEFNRNLLNF